MIYAWFISRNTYRVDSALNMSMVQECTGNNTQYPQHAQRIQSIAAKGLIRAVRWYQRRISPLFGPSCKYYPTCSNYALTALRRFGAARGSVLTVLRLLRCRPWSRGGIDDVPQQFSIFYRFSWSKAHEEPRLTPLPTEESTD